MKKIISSILVAATVAAVAVWPASAESYTQQIQVPYFSTKPTIDGEIGADEWGEKSFSVDGSKAAIAGDTTPAADNTYAHYPFEYNKDTNTIVEGTEDEALKAQIKKCTYDVWLRWDEKYFYLAAKVNDPDGYYKTTGYDAIWDGDCVQFRLDPMGPNSYLTYKNPDYDYTTEAFDYKAASVVGYTPWAYNTKICNIGLGTNQRDVQQAYDMSDGTGNMTGKLQLNDNDRRLGPDGSLSGGKDMSALFAMTVTDNGDGSSVNTYELALPWAYVDQWNLGQVAVGYAWGMSLVVLYGSSNSPVRGGQGGYHSFLTWGSGICGDQQDFELLRPTCGGSNAVILSDKDALTGNTVGEHTDALTGETVSSLPKAEEKSTGDVEHVARILDARGIDAYYLGSTTEILAENFNYSASIDVAYIAEHPLYPDKTHFGYKFGNGYGMFAGWDASSKKIVVAEHMLQDGINKEIPYAESEEEFDWQPGEWHTLGLTIKETVAQVYVDGKLVLTDDDSRNRNSSGSSEYQILIYNMGDYVLDNYLVATGDYNLATGTGGRVIASYTMDTDDAEFEKSDFKLSAIPSSFEAIEAACKRMDETSDYGCNMKRTVSNGKSVMKCEYCGYEEELDTVLGDVNSDGEITTNDVVILLRYLAGWNVTIDTVAADVNNDGEINSSDAVMILRKLAGWNVNF